MADAALFLGWKAPTVGREGQAMELFTSALGFWNKQKDGGKIESFEPVILSRHGGDMNGFILVRGDRAKLDEIKKTDEFMSITAQASFCIDGFGVVDAYVGDGVARIMGEYGKVVAKG
jgi:hypothetical protein